MHLYGSLCLLQNECTAKKSIQERLLSQEEMDSECFPVSIGVCAAFPSRRACRNCCEGLEEMLLGGVLYESAIGLLIFFPFLFV